MARWSRERCGRRWLYSSVKASSWVCSSVIVVAAGWWVSHFLRVCWNRSTLPQVVGGGVDLDDVQAAEFAFELVASALSAGESGGEHHAVVGQCGCWNAMGGMGFAECVEDDGSGDAVVGGDGECVAGVVVEPGQDFGVDASGDPPVGEVGLPALVGLFGGEADVGGLGSFRRGRCYQPGRGEVAADRGDRHREVVVMVQVPGDGVRSGVEALVAQGAS